MRAQIHTTLSIHLALQTLLLLGALQGFAFGASNTATLDASATVSGVNSLDVALLNVSDDQAAAKIQFPNSSSGVNTAAQYARITFDSNAIGARVIIRTDNRNSAVPFTGTGEGGGLVGHMDSGKTVPLLWAVFPDLPGAKAFVFKGDTDPSGSSKGSLPGSVERGAGEAEGFVVDKANPNFETQDVLNYATVVLPNGTNGLLGNFPTDEDGAGASTGLRSAASPVFLVLGSDFTSVSSQMYSTTTLGLDLVVQ